MEQQTKVSTVNYGQLITLAVGVGVANSVALDDIAVGVGISVAIFGTILATNLWKTNRNR